MSQARIISVINQKGGVGKTTTATSVAHGLALGGKRVLAIDMDPQSQFAISFGVHADMDSGIDVVLLDHVPISSQFVEVRNHVDLVPAGSTLMNVEKLTNGGVSRAGLLKAALDEIIGDYDVVVIDCPPSSGLLAINAMFATKEVLIPVNGDYLALEGLSRFMKSFGRIEQAMGHEIRQWIVLTRFHSRRRLAQDVKNKLIEYFPNKLLLTDISESSVLAECPGYGKSIFEYRASSRSADEYSNLVEDIEHMRVH